jgi:hypothetical protein
MLGYTITCLHKNIEKQIIIKKSGFGSIDFIRLQ